jgi:ketosteroid isomerase-like protein
MKSFALVATLFLAGTLATSAQTTISGTTEDDAAIIRLREGLIDSFNRSDIDGLLGFLDPDVVVTWQNGEVCQGPAEVKAYYDRMMKGDKPIVRKVTASPKVLGRQFHGAWAVSWGELNDNFELTDGRQLNFNSCFTATIAKRGDRWLVTAYHASINAFDNPVLSLAVKKVATIAVLGGAVAGLLIGLVLARFLRRPKGAGA